MGNPVPIGVSVSDAKLEFRSFNRETELPLQRELFRDAFPEAVNTTQESNEHYAWKFHSFPGTPPSYEYGAYYQGKMVGYYAAIPYRYKLNGIELTSAMVCDVMTHSSMRGKGIFTKLGAYALEQMKQAGLDIAFGYPIRPEVIPGHLKVGWKISGDLPLQVKIIKVNSALQNHPLRFLTPLINLGCGVYGIIFSAKRKKEFLVKRSLVNEFIAFPETREFLRKLNNSKESTLIRDERFLSWRYGAPGISYTVVSVTENGRLLAAAFIRKAILKGVPTVAVLDLMIEKEANEVLSALFFEILVYARELRAQMIALMISEQRAKELKLFKFGYIRSPFVFKLITKILSDKPNSVGEVSANTLNPMWVDSDDL